MNPLLRVPSPDGNLAVLERTAEILGQTTDAMHAEADRLASVARGLTGDWDGLSASAFAQQAATAQAAVAAIAASHSRAGAQISHYAHMWAESDRASRRAHDDILSAVDRFERDARSGVDQILSHLRSFLDNAIVDTLLDFVPAIEHALRTIANWHPPTYRPELLPSPHLPRLPSLGSILGALDTGLDLVMDAARGVADFVGGVISTTIGFIHRVEQAFAHAVQQALTMAWNALKAAWEFGKKVAHFLADLACEVAEAIYKFGGYLLEGAKNILEGMMFGAELLLTLLVALGNTFANVQRIVGNPLGAWNDYQNQKRRNDEASVKFNRSTSEQAKVDERLQLCRDSYKIYDQPRGASDAPIGWEFVEEVNGADGFHATVYRDVSTGEYVVAYRGTEFTSDQDWKDNFRNGRGETTSQGRQAVDLALRIAERAEHEGVPISFTGHSLGGEFAAMASIATGAPATTFNAEGVGAGNRHLAESAAGPGSGTDAGITNFKTPTDILSNIQEGTGNIPAAGAQVTLATTADPLHNPLDIADPLNPMGPLGGVGTIDNVLNMVDAHSLDRIEWTFAGMSRQRAHDLHPSNHIPEVIA